MVKPSTSAYYAHTGHRPDGQDWQPLKDHLASVAQLAQTRTQAFGAADWAHLVGLLHDLGKYAQAFQQRLLCESRWRGAK
jgi:CRISPR-associated endonuclease/helicase Cas3